MIEVDLESTLDENCVLVSFMALIIPHFACLHYVLFSCRLFFLSFIILVWNWKSVVGSKSSQIMSSRSNHVRRLELEKNLVALRFSFFVFYIQSVNFKS